jgi:hypothetical protein
MPRIKDAARQANGFSRRVVPSCAEVCDAIARALMAIERPAKKTLRRSERPRRPQLRQRAPHAVKIVYGKETDTRNMAIQNELS